MKVIYKNYMGTHVEGDLEGVLVSELQRVDYNTRGVAECAREVADRTAAAVAKLVVALVEADRLTLNEAEAICEVRGELTLVPTREFIGVKL